MSNYNTHVCLMGWVVEVHVNEAGTWSIIRQIQECGSVRRLKDFSGSSRHI